MSIFFLKRVWCLYVGSALFEVDEEIGETETVGRLTRGLSVPPKNSLVMD